MPKNKIDKKTLNEINDRLVSFGKKNEREKFLEFLFCILTPQSNAQRCWQAVLEIDKLKKIDFDNVREILKSRVRFHNTKAKRIVEANEKWSLIRKEIEKIEDPVYLRNWLCENVNGYGLKEAGHFLRNIGKSENKIAILDRHILRNLKALNIIKDEKIKGRKNYLEIEDSFKKYSEEIGIELDKLDMFWWSQENGEIFK